MSNLEYKGFDGHIILYCKHQYKHSDNFIEDLKRIWAIRCGYEYSLKDNSMIRNICDRLYKILLPTIKNHEYFQCNLHDTITSGLYNMMPMTDKILLFYVGELANLQVREKVNTRYKWLIKLPKPQRRIFNRIIKGDGKFNDYKLIN